MDTNENNAVEESDKVTESSTNPEIKENIGGSNDNVGEAKESESTAEDEIKETDDSPIINEAQIEPEEGGSVATDELNVSKEGTANYERESSKEKDSDSCETTCNEESEETKLVEEIISDECDDNVETPKVEEVDIYSMRKESLKNVPWVDSEDDSDIPDPDLDIPQNKILWAAEKNEIEALRQLLEEDPTLVNSRDEDGYTPLHRASYNNHVEVMKLLLTYNADMGAKTEDQWEPLHCACKWDSVETASLLIQNGANVNATTKGGLTPLHLAASNSGGRRTLELLLWHPYVDPTIKSERGDTAYDTACQNSPHYKLFEMIDISINCY